LGKIFSARHRRELLDVERGKLRRIFWTYNLAMPTKDALGLISDHYSAFSLLKDTPDTYRDAEAAKSAPVFLYPNDLHS
jgi:hypothetical protein